MAPQKQPENAESSYGNDSSTSIKRHRRPKDTLMVLGSTESAKIYIGPKESLSHLEGKLATIGGIVRRGDDGYLVTAAYVFPGYQGYVPPVRAEGLKKMFSKTRQIFTRNTHSERASDTPDAVLKFNIPDANSSSASSGQSEVTSNPSIIMSVDLGTYSDYALIKVTQEQLAKFGWDYAQRSSSFPRVYTIGEALADRPDGYTPDVVISRSREQKIRGRLAFGTGLIAHLRTKKCKPLCYVNIAIASSIRTSDAGLCVCDAVTEKVLGHLIDQENPGSNFGDGSGSGRLGRFEQSL
ncbi:hypothetical protein G7Y89_g9759 [Cudoniella acicularis]|uniref:Uncharacterized protein n=1 Tax=Cudoniella acicularis TaxID=354080 RepID=A0A8H4RFL4_9HELO|nr:hypothetical protein G7Y89_g9759 [Cudoniella acicularis]